MDVVVGLLYSKSAGLGAGHLVELIASCVVVRVNRACQGISPACGIIYIHAYIHTYVLDGITPMTPLEMLAAADVKYVFYIVLCCCRPPSAARALSRLLPQGYGEPGGYFADEEQPFEVVVRTRREEGAAGRGRGECRRFRQTDHEILKKKKHPSREPCTQDLLYRICMMRSSLANLTDPTAGWRLENIFPLNTNVLNTAAVLFVLPLDYGTPAKDAPHARNARPPRTVPPPGPPERPLRRGRALVHDGEERGHWLPGRVVRQAQPGALRAG